MTEGLQDRFLTIPDILERVPWSYPTLRRRILDKLFPEPKRLGGRVAWLERDYDAWHQSAAANGVVLPKKLRTQTEEITDARSV